MTAVIGVVLAGGLGRRMGGAKAVAELGGRPLLEHPLEALGEVCDRLAVVAKRDSVLPPLADDVELWTEPDEPRHPLTGLLHALDRAGGEDILACAVDLVAIDEATLRAILQAAAEAPGAQAVVPRAAGDLQPLCAVYRPAAVAGIEGHEPGARVRDVVGSLAIAEVVFEDGAPFFNVNTPDELDQLRRA